MVLLGRLSHILLGGLAWPAGVAAAPTGRAPYRAVQTTSRGAVVFALADTRYLADAAHPVAAWAGGLSKGAPAAPRPDGDSEGALVPLTVVYAPDGVVTGDVLRAILQRYREADDVFSDHFLEAMLVARNGTGPSRLDQSALGYLQSLELGRVFLDSSFGAAATSCCEGLAVNYVTGPSDGAKLAPGPYVASVASGLVSIYKVYRLYPDTYRDFLYGTYESNDGTASFHPVEVRDARQGAALIPVPSRIYSWNDPRPFAGYRVGIKDLFDMKGLITSGGSRAWSELAPAANETAPSIQRIVDLGGVLVGKNKLAQFASGADPWGWQDEQYPFNPRGDGWLTCSASSSGGGCAVAAYDWLDFAIGSDTGSSMRRPAAVSGTYGNRPSQGLMTLEKVMPLGAATDTAGVFARDPRAWAHFSRHWYIPSLHADPSITGLTPLDIPDSAGFPTRIIYLTDYLPLHNPAAEALLQAFIGNMTSMFGMTVEAMNLTARVGRAPDEVPKYPELREATAILNRVTQWKEVGKPLVEGWAARYDGRFPPIDPARRHWSAYNESAYTDERYARALATKRRAVDWFEAEVLRRTARSCSESVLLWDIGTGGRPSYRERALIEGAGDDEAAFLDVRPPTAGINGDSLCPIYGCVDMTLPLGQVPYRSRVTLVEEMVPVTVNIIARRGCDFVLWDMWERLARAGGLQEVRTGRTAF